MRLAQVLGVDRSLNTGVDIACYHSTVKNEDQRTMLFAALQTVTLVIAGLMVGNELAVSAFIHPQLHKLDDSIHAASAQAFARVYGAVMPFWYALTLILTIAIASLLWQTGTPFFLAAASTIFLLASILLTVTRLVPINNQVSHWNLASLPNDWQQLRNQWDRLHRVRVLILMIALVLLTSAALMALETA